jgi:hypothetical protein
MGRPQPVQIDQSVTNYTTQHITQHPEHRNAGAERRSRTVRSSHGPEPAEPGAIDAVAPGLRRFAPATAQPRADFQHRHTPERAGRDAGLKRRTAAATGSRGRCDPSGQSSHKANPVRGCAHAASSTAASAAASSTARSARTGTRSTPDCPSSSRAVLSAKARADQERAAASQGKSSPVRSAGGAESAPAHAGAYGA